MDTKRMKKLEHFIDIFKGTCEINNYSYVGASAREDNKPIDSQIYSVLKDSNGELEKKYFYGTAYENGEHLEFGAVLVGYESEYRLCELITMANKILYNADIYETIIFVDTDNDHIEELLDMTDQPTKIESLNRERHDKDLAFEITVGDRTVVHGGKEGNKTYFKIDYRAIEDYIDFDIKDTMDVYIMPKDKEVLDDAFAITTNLKDSGFKIEVDYELEGKEPKELDADFLITFDKKDIEKYTVHLKDLKTKEEREIMIDNLVEELSFL